MEPDAVLDLFRRQRALLDGHFRLSSGLHSRGYLQSALVLQEPRHAERLGVAIAESFRLLGVTTVVLAPALGGIIIGHEVARALGTRALFAERKDGALTLRRGFVLESGARVAVVEDVLTTGGSTRETVEVTRAAGARVVGAAAIIDRSTRGANLAALDVPFRALARVSLPVYEPAECPLCAEGVPLTKPGSR